MSDDAPRGNPGVDPDDLDISKSEYVRELGDDRFAIDFDLSEDSDKPNLLSEGDEVTIKINTMAGATTTIRFTVPESLGQKKAVEL